jgi:hypothetical protein
VRGFWANQPTADRRSKQLGLIRFEGDIESVVVQMGRHIVFLPGGGDVYAHLAATLGNGTGTQFKLDLAEVWRWPSKLLLAWDEPSPNDQPG